MVVGVSIYQTVFGIYKLIKNSVPMGNRIVKEYDKSIAELF